MTDTRPIKRVGIIGGGLMGRGIAQSCATAGFVTTLIKASGQGADETRARIEKSLAKAVQRGKLSNEEAEQALARLIVTGERETLGRVDLVIESIVEDLSIKRALFAELLSVVPTHCILASNTSTLRIADLAPPDAEVRTLGLHFFSPVPAMRLVELAYLPQTSVEARELAGAFVEGLGKTPIEVIDSSGFIVNRLLVPYLLGAIAAYSQGLAPATNIDTAMHLGCGHPVGPLMLCDLIGLDIVYSMSKLLYRDFGDDRFRPPALLRRLVQDRQLGKKTGAGFYDHSNKPATPNQAVWQLISEGKHDTGETELAS